MINKTTDIPHSVAVDDESTVQIKTIVVTVIRILLRHSSSELLLPYHLPQVFTDEVTFLQRLFAAYAVASVLSDVFLQSFCTFAFLHATIAALVASGARVGVAFCEH